MNRVIKKKTLTIIAILSLAVFLLGRDSLWAAPPDLPPGLAIAAAVQEAHTANLMAIPDVVGTAVGLDDIGKPVIQVLLASDKARGIPQELNGFRVVTKVTGPLVAYKGRPGGGGGGGGGGTTTVDPKAKQPTPIKLGTSGGWRYDLANGYCCGGTLGSLIKIDNTQYILSNYHIFYSDIVSGGNGRAAGAGDPVIQPGLIDVQCSAGNAQDVATLVNNGGSLPGANVDAGIAKVIDDQVDPSGAILNIGTISSATVAASLNQAVKKMGRTTGLSKATVSGLNATVSITYSNECAGGTAFTKTFTGQIITTNSSCKFLNGGDSGSLMVEDVTTNPKAVGLLFAGSSICYKRSIAIANPIGHVLSYFGASMVGN